MTSPTTSAREALETLLTSVCASERTADFVARWGEPGPSLRTPVGIRIADPADPAVAALEVRPWDGGAVGVVEVDLAPEAAPSWQEVRQWLGPFEELPRLHPGAAALAAEWWQPPLPVSATVLVIDPGAPEARLMHLSIRRGRSHP